jgi:uroporphyrinogen decarboxylase
MNKPESKQCSDSVRHSLIAAFWKHHPIADQTAEALCAETLKFYDEVQSDVIKLTPAGNYQVADRGGIAHWDGDAMGRRTFSERYVQSEREWQTIADLPIVLTAIETEIVRSAELLLARQRCKRPIYVTIFAPLTQAFMLAGELELQRCLQQHPVLLRAVLDKLSATTRLLLHAYRDIGVTHFYIAMQHRSQAILPQALYKTLNDTSDVYFLNEVLNSQAQTTCKHTSVFPAAILHVHGSGVYFDDLPAHCELAVHYELTPENPHPRTFLKQRDNPLVLGIPLNVWQASSPAVFAEQVEPICAILEQHKILVTTPCVVPQALPNKEVASWVTLFSQYVHNLQ